MRRLTYWLADPILRNYPFGSAAWFSAQQALIQSKPLIHAAYERWYRYHLDDADTVAAPGLEVELGAGGSFLKQMRPEIVTTDMTTGRVDLVCDARGLPFPAQSVRALFLAHVYHHIPDIRLFLEEARRVLVPGGVISIIDCAHTPFGRFFFSAIHPEPYNSGTREWSFPAGESFLDSNQALTWITLIRDRAQFLREYPEFTIEGPDLLPWFTYLMSGGVNLRSFLPQSRAQWWLKLDRWLRPLDPAFAVHWHFRLRLSGQGLRP